MRIDPRRFFEFLLLLMLTMCPFFLYLRNIGDQRALRLYCEAERLVGVADAGVFTPAPPAVSSPAEDAPEVETKEDAPDGMDLSPLQEVNADVAGWIEIPGILSYPLLQREERRFLNSCYKELYNVSKASSEYLVSRGLLHLYTSHKILLDVQGVSFLQHLPKSHTPYKRSRIDRN